MTQQGWGVGDGGEDELQRVIQTGQLRFSESFLEASMIFSRVWEGEHWPTLVIELLTEKGGSQRMVDIVRQVEPNDAGGPLRFEVGVFSGVKSLGLPGVWRTKGEELNGSRPNDYSSIFGVKLR